MRRDGRNIGQNDNLSIVIDSFYDRRNGYEFLVNAVGGMADAQITDERDVNRDWNTVWQYRAKRDAGGWTAEMAFPFRSLRYRPGATQVWGLNIRRTIRWKNEFVYLEPGAADAGRARDPEAVVGAARWWGWKRRPRSLNLDIKPYALGAAKADRAVDPTFEADLRRRRRRGREVRHHARPDGGLHLPHRLRAGRRRRPAGQPHALQPVLPREARVLPGRPGHLRVWRRRDGAARRHVARPGEYAGALLQPADRPAGQRAGAHRGRRPDDGQGRPLQRGPAEHPDRRRARHRRGVHQLRRRAPEARHPAAQLHRRDRHQPFPALGDDGTNSVFGVDTGFAFYDSLTMVGYYAKTNTPGLHDKDHSYRGRFDYQADRLGVTVEHLGVGENFKPEVGFLRRSDFVESLAQLRISRRPRVVAVRAAHQPRVRARLHHQRRARAGEPPVPDGAPHGDAKRRLVERALREHLRVRAGRRSRCLAASWFRSAPTATRLAWRSTRWAASARSPARSAPAMAASTTARRTDLSYRGRIELMPQLSLEPGIGVNWIDLPQGETIAKLASVRSTYSFSPSMWLAALLQYNSTQTLFSSNVRFKWEYRPGSDLFVVYSDGRDTVDRFRPALQNRSLAVKVTRLFRVR